MPQGNCELESIDHLPPCAPPSHNSHIKVERLRQVTAPLYPLHCAMSYSGSLISTLRPFAKIRDDSPYIHDMREYPFGRLSPSKPLLLLFEGEEIACFRDIRYAQAVLVPDLVAHRD
jgi:hypothetical protein